MLQRQQGRCAQGRKAEKQAADAHMPGPTRQNTVSGRNSAESEIDHLLMKAKDSMAASPADETQQIHRKRILTEEAAAKAQNFSRRPEDGMQGVIEK